MLGMGLRASDLRKATATTAKRSSTPAKTKVVRTSKSSARSSSDLPRPPATKKRAAK